MGVPPTVMLTIFLGASAVLSGQSQQENWKRCENNDPEQRIAPCSALIQSGRETASNLAKAFYRRGSAYVHKNDYDHAIQYYDQALPLNPNLADVFYGRGWVYQSKGDL
jgi:tetratricopeptide (TPR) repeat protein